MKGYVDYKYNIKTNLSVINKIKLIYLESNNSGYDIVLKIKKRESWKNKTNSKRVKRDRDHLSFTFCTKDSGTWTLYRIKMFLL